MIDPEIARQYHKLSYRCQHYPGEIAVIQKIQALAGRSVTQARDVFDLGILHMGGYATLAVMNKFLSDKVRLKATDNLIGLEFEDFDGQVVGFLNTEDRIRWGSVSAWDQLQLTILELLGNA